MAAVLHVAAFAEEMNKSRRMVARQAKALADLGCEVLVLDLKGCGDSDGDFDRLAWSDWVEDVRQAAQWLLRRGHSNLWLWGHRAGCLIAAQAAQGLPLRCNFLFWAPVTSGKQHLQQFLRLRSAAEMINGGGQATTARLRQELAEGSLVEIAGYSLGSALASGMERATLAPAALNAHGLSEPAPRLLWLETSSKEAATLSPVAQGCIREWASGGYAVTGQIVRGPAFWQTVEIEDADQLIESTSRALLQELASEHSQAPSRSKASEAEPPEERDAGESDKELALAFESDGERLVGVLTCPDGDPGEVGVVVVVGGPQYRVGSHRQFVLLARALAAGGFPVFRFDYRGMGDSDGSQIDFLSAPPDIGRAIDCMASRVPSLKRFVLWGLCDGASAALMYVDQSGDRRVGGLCLVNPWVRSPESLASAQVKHYYWKRIRQREFWHKLVRGQGMLIALKGLAKNVVTVLRPVRTAAEGENMRYQDRMARAWRKFDSAIALMLSGEDLTAREFLEYAGMQSAWKGLLELKHVDRHDIPGADHTLSNSEARQRLEALTLQWLVARVRHA